MEIEIKDSEINVEAIIKKMKSELASRNIEENINDLLLNFESTPYNNDAIVEIQMNLDIANKLWNIPAEYSITSHRRLLGPLIIFGKKVVRKLLRWYINPIVKSQNEYNQYIIRAMNATFHQLKLNETVIKDLQSEVINLRKSNQELSRRVDKGK